VIICAICGLFLAFVSTGMSQDSTVPVSPGIARIQGKGTLVVATLKNDLPPFIWTNEVTGELQGLDVELAKSFAAGLGVSPVFLRTAETCDDVIASVASREADIGIGAISWTPRRASKVLFAKPYLKLKYALFANRLMLATEKRSAQPVAKTIGIQGMTHLGIAETFFPDMPLRVYDATNSVAMFKDVVDGTIFAVFADELRVREWQRVNIADALYVTCQILETSQDAVGVVTHWQDGHFREWLNTRQSQMESDKALPSLRETYLGKKYRD